MPMRATQWTCGRIYVLCMTHGSTGTLDLLFQGDSLVQTEQAGPGIAFAESALPNWQETMEMRALRAAPHKLVTPLDRVEVEVRLQDILLQGGLVYPVESVTVERVWYCTLSAGSVEVREVR